MMTHDELEARIGELSRQRGELVELNRLAMGDGAVELSPEEAERVRLRFAEVDRLDERLQRLRVGKDEEPARILPPVEADPDDRWSRGMAEARVRMLDGFEPVTVERVPERNGGRCGQLLVPRAKAEALVKLGWCRWPEAEAVEGVG